MPSLPAVGNRPARLAERRILYLGRAPLLELYHQQSCQSMLLVITVHIAFEMCNWQCGSLFNAGSMY